MTYDDTITTDVYYKIYTNIGSFLSSKARRGAVIYSLESNPNGELVQRMIRNGVANAAVYIRHGALTIIDHRCFCQPTDSHYSRILADKLSSTVIELHNSYGFDNFLLFSRTEKLSQQGDFTPNMIFEQQLDDDFHSNILKDRNHDTDKVVMDNNLSIEAICVYKKKFLEARTPSELIKLVR